MPELARFLGIIIRMFSKDHPPAHFHAKYGDDKCSVSIETGEVIAGKLPPKQEKQVKEWAKEHKNELLLNWNEAQSGNPNFKKII